MPAVRRSLGMLRELNLDLFSDDGKSRVVVDRKRDIIVGSKSGLARPASGQRVLDVLDVIAPFPTEPGMRGPDLREPRPHLRIVPGKLSGEPHVAETRLETQALAALARRGVSVADILVLYPFVVRAAVEEALDLEDQLTAETSSLPRLRWLAGLHSGRGRGCTSEALDCVIGAQRRVRCAQVRLADAALHVRDVPHQRARDSRRSCKPRCGELECGPDPICQSPAVDARQVSSVRTVFVGYPYRRKRTARLVSSTSTKTARRPNPGKARWARCAAMAPQGRISHVATCSIAIMESACR